jgi:hypothetical protein
MGVENVLCIIDIDHSTMQKPSYRNILVFSINTGQKVENSGEKSGEKSECEREGMGPPNRLSGRWRVVCRVIGHVTNRFLPLVHFHLQLQPGKKGGEGVSQSSFSGSLARHIRFINLPSRSALLDLVVVFSSSTAASP